MTHDEMIAVIQAHKDGKTIQVRSHREMHWVDCFVPPFWDFHAHDYRVKPEKNVAYFNIYREHPRTSVYAVRHDADKGCFGAEHLRIACVRIEYTEGQFDE